MRLPSLLFFLLLVSLFAEDPAPLAGTQSLTVPGDLSAQMVAGIDRWLMRETERVAKARHLDVSTPEAREKARALLRQRLGIATEEPRCLWERLDVIGSGGPPKYTVRRVQWPVVEGVFAQGLLYEPEKESKVTVIVLPDPGLQPPEIAPSLRVARFAEQGCTVLELLLVGRESELSGSERLGRQTVQPHREWLYRPAFEVGRTLMGYEVQSVLAALPWIKEGQRVGICGYGEGGLIALHAAALEPRFVSVLISGHFAPRERLWEEPIYRNVWGLLRDFGDAELAAVSEAKTFVVEYSESPKVVPPASLVGKGPAAPGKVTTPDFSSVQAEAKRATEMRTERAASEVVIVSDGEKAVGPGSDAALKAFFRGLGVEQLHPAEVFGPLFADNTPRPDEHRLVRELEARIQRVLRECERVRYQLPLWTKLKPGPEWEAVQKAARADFWENVIGKLPTDYLPPNPRTRQIYDREKWRGYDVMLDVHPDIFAWGILLVPKDLKPGERRPVVVCQHGLEGLPEDTINEDPKSRAFAPYQGFAARLADRGFIVYAPHNPYRGGDKFRVLQRKANPLGLTLFSFIIAQHDVTTRWLASLPFVDPERIAFYGLSYGGKTAMRVPAVLERYCLSICSGDFNEWVLKCATTEHSFGYVFSNEYEIFEWDLGHRFNYAEMALLIAPRPFMVERGHNDGVAVDEWVGYEYAKVKRAYDQLGIGDRTEIEWFNGPHTIHGVGTFQFLHHWLRWPE